MKQTERNFKARYDEKIDILNAEDLKTLRTVRRLHQKRWAYLGTTLYIQIE
jgi:hypothetical protein